MTDNTTGYTQPPSQGLAIASMVLGILSILFAWIPIVGMISWVLSILGLVLGFMALSKPVGKGFAWTGIVTSGIGLLICILWVIGLGALMATSAATVS